MTGGRAPRGGARREDGAPVVYIAGSGRSGSTLLDRVLGQVEGVIAVGELAQVWRPGELAKLVCGCGEPVRTCPLWLAVAEEAYGGWDTEDFAEAVQLRARVTRHRHLPLRLLPVGSRSAERRRFGELAGRMYDAIARVSGAAVVVDSSKEAAFAYVLAPALGRRLRLVHLVRHGVGVAHSWTKAVAKPEVGNPDATLPRYHPGRMGARWVGYNLLIEALRLRVRTLAVRYESLVRDPTGTTRRILEHAGHPVPADALGFISTGAVTLAPTHTVAGNPMRFRQGDLELREDEAWRSDMRPRDRALVTAVASPLLLRFGYLRGLRRRVGAAR